jgi:hypothetical protein
MAKQNLCNSCRYYAETEQVRREAERLLQEGLNYPEDLEGLECTNPKGAHFGELIPWDALCGAWEACADPQKLPGGNGV